MDNFIHTKDIDFVPVLFYQEELNSERKHGRLSRYTPFDDHSAVLYFEPLSGEVPETLVIRYYDKTDYELITLSRFMRREFGKEN